MKPIRDVFNFYINASIHVAFAVCALVGVTQIEYDLELPLALWGIVFFGTISGYNFVKFAEASRLGHRGTGYSIRSIQIFSLTCFGVLIYFALQLAVNTLLLIAFFALLTFFYVVPLLKHKNLRTFSGLKVFIVGFVWAGVTVILPIFASEISLTSYVWINFSQRFLLVVALTLPFEIRDLRWDTTHLKTIPQQLGLKNTKFIGLLLLVFCVVLEGLKDSVSLIYFCCLVLVSVVISLALLKSTKDQPKYFASFWVESIPIFWLGILLLSTKLFVHLLL
jgi:hypothetical protein